MQTCALCPWVCVASGIASVNTGTRPLSQCLVMFPFHFLGLFNSCSARLLIFGFSFRFVKHHCITSCVHTYAVQSRLNAAECGIFRGRRRAVWLCNEKDCAPRGSTFDTYNQIRIGPSTRPKDSCRTRFDTGDLQSSAEMSMHLHLLYIKLLECHFKF